MVTHAVALHRIVLAVVHVMLNTCVVHVMLNTCVVHVMLNTCVVHWYLHRRDMGFVVRNQRVKYRFA